MAVIDLDKLHECIGLGNKIIAIHTYQAQRAFFRLGKDGYGPHVEENFKALEMSLKASEVLLLWRGYIPEDCMTVINQWNASIIEPYRECGFFGSCYRKPDSRQRALSQLPRALSQPSALEEFRSNRAIRSLSRTCNRLPGHTGPETPRPSREPPPMDDSGSARQSQSRTRNRRPSITGPENPRPSREPPPMDDSGSARQLPVGLLPETPKVSAHPPQPTVATLPTQALSQQHEQASRLARSQLRLQGTLIERLAHRKRLGSCTNKRDPFRQNARP